MQSYPGRRAKEACDRKKLDQHLRGLDLVHVSGIDIAEYVTLQIRGNYRYRRIADVGDVADNC